MSDQREYNPADRRPIASRGLSWVKATASWLVKRGVSPNAISICGVVFALCAAAALVLTSHTSGTQQRLLWFAVALGVQLRLLANLFDGMVAVESGKASPLGEIFNEVPDRISDAAILIALGFAAQSSAHLGYIAAVLALFVAYVRAAGAVSGAGQVFAGVLGKSQRMFVVTLLCLFESLAPIAWRDLQMPCGHHLPSAVLLLICFGCVVTAITRLRTITRTLKASQ